MQKISIKAEYLLFIKLHTLLASPNNWTINDNECYWFREWQLTHKHENIKISIKKFDKSDALILLEPVEIKFRFLAFYLLWRRSRNVVKYDLKIKNREKQIILEDGLSTLLSTSNRITTHEIIESPTEYKAHSWID